MEQRQIREVFGNLRSIHKDREQYNLEWAFRNAQTEMDIFRSKILKGKVEQECAECAKSQEAMEKYQNLVEDSRAVGKKSKWYQRFFHNMYALLTLAEATVSFALVFLLSQISHMGGSLFHSQGLSILFAMTFSFLKVVLERVWVEPRMNHWGWKVYIDSVDRLDRLTMELMHVTTGDSEMMQATQIPFDVMGGMQNEIIKQIENAGMAAQAKFE